MVDTRELVLVRLLEIVAAIPNIRWAQRNNIEIPEQPSLWPAAVVLDADEETDDAGDIGQRPANRPTLVRMMPEIVIVQQADEVGSELTTLRRELIRRVLTDGKLNDQIVKTSKGGVIRYLGCQTDLGWGRTMQGALLAQFMFMYSLNPNEL